VSSCTVSRSLRSSTHVRQGRKSSAPKTAPAGEEERRGVERKRGREERKGEERRAERRGEERK